MEIVQRVYIVFLSPFWSLSCGIALFFARCGWPATVLRQHQHQGKQYRQQHSLLNREIISILIVFYNASL